jgi:hypothetical protein
VTSLVIKKITDTFLTICKTRRLDVTFKFQCYYFSYSLAWPSFIFHFSFAILIPCGVTFYILYPSTYSMFSQVTCGKTYDDTLIWWRYEIYIFLQKIEFHLKWYWKDVRFSVLLWQISCVKLINRKFSKFMKKI